MTERIDTDRSSIAERARSDDNSALGELVERYRGYLTLLVKLRLNSNLRAKIGESDIVQQSLLEAVRDFDSYRGSSESELLCWLRTIVARNLTDTIRRFCITKKRDICIETSIEQRLGESSVVFEQALISQIQSPSAHAAEREGALIVSRALAQLPHHYREVVIRRNFEGQTFPEIAESMGRSLDSVKNTWFRAFDELRRMIKDSH